MLFETLTLSLLAKTWIAWKATKSATHVVADSVQLQKYSNNAVQQNDTHILDKHQTERRNEIFLHVYSILISSDKSKIQQVSTLFKQLVHIYRISSKLDSEKIVEYVFNDFKEYVSSLKKNIIATDRFEALLPLLEYSSRTTKEGGFLEYYFRDIGKDKDYIEKVFPNIYGCFDLILHDRFSCSKYEVKTEDIKNYKCLLGTAGIVYDNMVKVLYDYKLFDARGRLSYELLYEIADYILEMTHFYFCKGLTTERLAKDITDSIIHYIHNAVKINQEFAEKYGGHPKQYVEKLIERYLLNREIENYYYFLKMACKVLEALHFQDVQKNISQEDKVRIEIAKKELVKMDLPILSKFEETEILEDIKKAFEYKDAKLPEEIQK